MSDRRTLDAIETAELILQVDIARPAADPFKLSATLNTLFTTRLSDTQGKHVNSRGEGPPSNKEALPRSWDLLDVPQFSKTITRKDLASK